jgi:Animal haem peroxidase
MPRIAHGASITPEQLQQAQEALASQVAEVGLAFAVAAPAPQQDFRFMFPDLQNPANRLPTSARTVKRLKELGRTMVEDEEGAVGDAERLPAIYTYFGQFIDHDITLQKGHLAKPADLVKDELGVLGLADIRALKNARTARVELDSLYGGAAPTVGAKMKLGKVSKAGDRPPGKGDDNDLPRLGRDTAHPETDRAAQIGDDRNDENLIISQLHLAFLKAHNRLIDQGKTFAQAQRFLRQHYQHLVVFDFLRRRVADASVVDDVLENGNRLYHPEVEPFFMPMEFSVAAFRFGHTMVRNQYNYNRNFPEATLDQLFTFTALSGDLGDFDTLPENWIIEWEKFIAHLGGRNPARRLDTTLASGLFGLRKITGAQERPADAANLAVRNLLRGYALRMPTGQAVARKIKQEVNHPVHVLTPNELLKVARESGNKNQATALKDGNFHQRTPLWYYLLAEAKHLGKGNRLGPVGSRIVAEVLVGLVRRSEDSILRDPDWKPTIRQANPPNFVLPDLLRFAKVAQVGSA